MTVTSASTANTPKRRRESEGQLGGPKKRAKPSSNLTEVQRKQKELTEEAFRRDKNAVSFSTGNDDLDTPMSIRSASPRKSRTSSENATKRTPERSPSQSRSMTSSRASTSSSRPRGEPFLADNVSFFNINFKSVTRLRRSRDNGSLYFTKCWFRLQKSYCPFL